MKDAHAVSRRRDDIAEHRRQNGDRRTRGVSKDDICDSRKFVSKHVYPVTGPDSPMCEVGACLL